MTEGRRVRIVVDAMGGDHAPGPILEGVEMALAHDPDLEVVLTGPSEVIHSFSERSDRLFAHPTTELIAMDEHPAQAVRNKKDSSIVAGCRIVKEGGADGFFSAGSTGAVMAAATLVMGRVKGVSRPAIATVLPTVGSPVVLLDVGANAECKPEHLLQFALMGSAYAQTVLGVTEPRVGLLNIGEEPGKGSQLTIDAYRSISAALPGFAGNVEGREILDGRHDVIVTDGFTGNVALKLLEGTSRVLLGQIKDVMTATPLRKAAASVLAPGLRSLKKRLDPDTYGGAPLLGVKGICIIGHGSSGASAVTSAIGVATMAARGDLSGRIARSVAQTASQ